MMMMMMMMALLALTPGVSTTKNTTKTHNCMQARRSCAPVGNWQNSWSWGREIKIRESVSLDAKLAYAPTWRMSQQQFFNVFLGMTNPEIPLGIPHCQSRCWHVGDDQSKAYMIKKKKKEQTSMLISWGLKQKACVTNWGC